MAGTYKSDELVSSLNLENRPNLRNPVEPEMLKGHMKHCAEQGKIPRYAIPDHYVIIDNIPKTSVGKTDKKRIREIYATAPQ